MPTALVTGLTGQDGTYLGELLLAKGYEVHGLVRDDSPSAAERIWERLPMAHLHQGDLTDRERLVNLISDLAPDEVYNLGALSSVAYSWRNVHATSDVTALGALNMLEAVRLQQDRSGRPLRFYQASSSEMYGNVAESPQNERTLLWPRSPYGVSKVFAHYMTINYRESYGLHASSGILFNHESPRRGPEFVTRKVARAAAAIGHGLGDSVALGNLDIWRDWGFAGDYVEAMWLMLQQERADDYVIATGEAHSLQEFVEIAFARVGLNWTGHVLHDPTLTRPADIEAVVGDPSKARSVLGWKSRVSFEELVWMMVDAEIADLSRARGGPAGTCRSRS